MLSATVVVQALNTWAMLAIAAMAPLVAEGLAVAAVLVGYQIAAMYLCAALTSLVAGGWVMRLGATRVSQISLLAAAGGLALAATGTLWGMLAASAAIGVGYGLVNPASSQLLFARTTPRDRSLVFSIKQTGVPLGGILAGLVTPVLALGFGWQAALGGLVPVLVLAALALEPARPRWDSGKDAPAGPVPSAAEGAAEVWASPALRRLCLASFLYGGVQVCLVGFVVAFAMADLGYGAVLAGALLATVQAAGAGARLGLGWAADRVQDNPAILTAAGIVAALGGVAFFALTPATPVLVVFGLAVVFGAGAVGWNGVFLAEVARRARPGRIGSVTGIAGMATFSGVVVLPALFAFAHPWLGSYGAGYLALVLASVVGAMLVRRVG
ncbi:MAG: MFS transporter [Alkalilacustris sp.]